MARKRFTPEQIIRMLREAEGRLSQGEELAAEVRKAGFDARVEHGG